MAEENKETVQSRMQGLVARLSPIANALAQSEIAELTDKLKSWEELSGYKINPSTRAGLLMMHQRVINWRKTNPDVPSSEYGDPRKKSDIRQHGFPEKFVTIYQFAMGYEVVPAPIYIVTSDPNNSAARDIFKKSVQGMSPQ